MAKKKKKTGNKKSGSKVLKFLEGIVLVGAAAALLVKFFKSKKK